MLWMTNKKKCAAQNLNGYQQKQNLNLTLSFDLTPYLW